MHKYTVLMDDVVADAAKCAIHEAERIMKDMDADGPDSTELKNLTNCIYILDMTDKIMSRHYPEHVEHEHTHDKVNGNSTAINGSGASIVTVR